MGIVYEKSFILKEISMTVILILLLVAICDF